MIIGDTSVIIGWDTLAIPVGAYASSSIVLAELEFGVATAATAREHVVRLTNLARFQAADLQWLPYTDSTATFHAELMDATHPQAPAKARARDLMIAATAYEHGATLATLNPKDLRYVGHLVDIVVPPVHAAVGAPS